jgi:NAD(P)-dependent dehydrogenase (short-subunit alcohol dehydrogenase family)
MEIPRRYRVDGKAAVGVGGGQTKGETIGNGRATATVLAREGARVLVADRHLASARETADMIVAEGGQAYAALYPHSDEAGFVTGVSLAVDGGEGVRWGS